ncbi:barstar family protein [Streptomyces subrutilus]|uniref:barstar family protein n=1 Tax=Streptomyces subrutilus TaxID=36818 RepID=UPI0014301667|nr:barstar family protein [Streptomyces subrutilus]
MDGQHVTDKPGLLLALGEALLGPGSAYGRGLDSVDYHLGGGLSVVPPFTLIWHRADIARHALARHTVDHRPDRSYFEVAVRILREHGVTVVLQ